jgi:hypothetical protein
MSASLDSPVYAVPEANLIPVGDYLKLLTPIPPSRMFLINKSLSVYRQARPGEATFDASQGDGGASLPGVPRNVLERAQQLQLEHGTGYDMPFGTDAYRKSVVEQYWLDPAEPGPNNVIGTQGGRCPGEGLRRHAGAGPRARGDPVIVSRVPWITHSWGPYGVGATCCAPPAARSPAGPIPKTACRPAWTSPPAAGARSPGS